MNVAEEFGSIFKKKVANFLLQVLVLLRDIFLVYLIAVNPSDGVVRVQHLSQLAEDVLDYIYHKLRINHLAQLVCLKVDPACRTTNSILVFVQALDAKVMLRDVGRRVYADSEHPFAVTITSILEQNRVQPENSALAQSRLEVRAKLLRASTVQLLIAKGQFII